MALVAASGCGGPGPDSGGRLLFREDFRGGLANWHVEAEQGGTVAARDGELVIDVPAGCTVWYKPVIEGPVRITYEARVVSGGGPNDRVSDLNCFWMARDARSPSDLFATPRTGRFAEYNPLRCYYVGLGGNGNTTTRFRRYIADPDVRPLLPEHDRRAPADLLVANRWQTIELVAAGNRVQYWRDGRVLFEMHDPEPYASGWFGLRTTANHMVIRSFRVYRLPGAPAARARSSEFAGQSSASFAGAVFPTLNDRRFSHREVSCPHVQPLSRCLPSSLPLPSSSPRRAVARFRRRRTSRTRFWRR